MLQCIPCHELDLAAGFQGSNPSHRRAVAATQPQQPWVGGAVEGQRRAAVGDRVRLAPGKAAEGPLGVGDEGVIEKDDGSAVPFQVRGPRGGLYWYREADIVRATGPVAEVRNTEGRLTHVGRDGFSRYCGAKVGKAGYWVSAARAACRGLQARDAP